MTLLTGCELTESEETQSSGQVAQEPPAAVARARIEVKGGLIQVAAQRDAVIRTVLVDEGQKVSRGQVLAIQDTRAAELQVSASEANLAVQERTIEELKIQFLSSKRELERAKQLVAKNAGSERELDEAQDALLLAEVKIAQAEARRAESLSRLEVERFEIEVRTIRSPVDGAIARRQAQPGVGASTLNVSTLFTIIPDSPLQVRAELDEIFINEVDVGQAVAISPEAQPETTYSGTVVRVGQILGQRPPSGPASGSDFASNPDQRVVEVVIESDDLPLLIGQRVLVRFERRPNDPSSKSN